MHMETAKGWSLQGAQTLINSAGFFSGFSSNAEVKRPDEMGSPSIPSRL